MSNETQFEVLTADEKAAIETKFNALFLSATKGRKLPTNLFHYTNSAGLIGIVESGTLRATHVAYLNDYTEYLHAVHLLLERVIQSRTPERSAIEHQLLNEMETILAATKSDNVNPFFVTCFSEDGNSLNQWRAYGRGEGAFSIGFDPQQLFDMARHSGALLCPVVYDRSIQAKVLEELVDWTLKEYPARAVLHTGSRRDRHRVEWVARLFRIGSGLAPIMKNPDFLEEKEWRVVKPLTGLGEVRFLAKERGLSAFIPLRLGKSQSNATPKTPKHVELLPDRLPISVVWTGPGQMKEISKMALQGLLEQNNYDGVRLEVSNIPYRVM